MKIMKSYRHLIAIIGVPFLLFCAVLTWFFTQPLVQLFKIHWLVLLIALGLTLSPLGKRRLASEAAEPPRHRPLAWLARIILLQLCFFAVFLAISTVCGRTAPALTEVHPFIFQRSLTELLIYEGLFPWAFFALLAVIMGSISYCRREDAYLATTLNPIIENTTLKIAVNFCGRLASLIAFASSIALISLLWASTLTTTPIVTGFYLTAILVPLILMIIASTKIFRRNVIKTLGRDLPLIPGLFCWVIFLAISIWLLNGFLAPLTNISLSPPSVLNHWRKAPWQDLWLIFANSWWLLWLPLMAAIIARISRGYRIREVILAILALPLALSLTLGLTRHLSWEIPPLAGIFIAGFGILGLFIMTLHKRVVPIVVLTYLPQQDHYKFRSYRSTFIKIIQFAICFLFIYFPGGVIVIHFLTFALALPILLIFAASITAFLIGKAA